MQEQTKWLGRALSASTAIIMIANGVTGLLQPHLVVAAMTGDGWPPETVLPISVLSLIGGLLYALPRTTIIGAIVITGFCGEHWRSICA